MSFGDMVKKLRKEQKMTQQELADKLHISRSTIAMYERGGHRPNYEILNALSRLFDVSVGYLTGSSHVRGHAAEPITPEMERFAVLEALLSPDEFAVLLSYQSAPESVRKAIHAILEVR